MNKGVVQGIGGRRNRKEELKRMIEIGKFMRGEKVEVKKIRKERTKEEKPRNQPERELRNQVIKELRRLGIRVYRIENSITGINNSGVPDLWVFNMNKNKAGFIELKSLKGILADNQKAFRESCLLCNVNHWVVRSVSDALESIA